MESSYVRIAIDGSNIIGFGRTVDDGKYYAIIADLVVDPMYQNKKIGKKILDELCEDLRNYKFTTLTAAVGKDKFYLKQGWKRQKSAFLWPRSPKQENEHTTNN